MMFNTFVKTILISLFVAGASTKISAAEMDGIAVKALTTGTKSLNPSQHEPKMLSFEINQNLKADSVLQSMLSYTDLLKYEQQNIDKYQPDVFDKEVKDIGKSVADFRLQERGVLESEQRVNRYYAYKFDHGRDCEVHLLSIDLHISEYDVSDNYC